MGREINASQSAVMLCSWGLKAGWLIPLVDKRVVWQVKLCDHINMCHTEWFRDQYCTYYKAKAVLYKCPVCIVVIYINSVTK